MPIYLRGNVYWIKVPGTGKAPIRESAGTSDRKAAQEYHDRRVAEVWRVRSLGERPRIALTDAIADWLTTHSVKKATHHDDKLRVRAMLPYLPDVQLHQITTGTLQRMHDAIVRGRKVSGVTANRYLEIISAVLHWHKKREAIDTVPSIPYASELRDERRFLTPQQAMALINALPRHLNRMARFALATGLRDANVRMLRWDRVDMERRHAWVARQDAKGRKSIAVPLTEDAMAALRECEGDDDEFVFVYRGKPIGKRANNTGFRSARKTAGVEWATWHTLRHSWASWHTMRGTPTAALTKLGGWSSRAMVDEVYGHLAPGFEAQWAENSKLVGTVADTVEKDTTQNAAKSLNLGWLMGLEPTTTGITTRDSTN